MKKIILATAILSVSVLFAGCKFEESSDTKQRNQQERILQEGTSQIGMPAVKNFRERKLMKDIIEMRDQNGLTTYTYRTAAMTGELILLCVSSGYPMPAATQFTNPEKYINQGTTMPQADPNGLFSPSSAEGSWAMCKDPNGTSVAPVYSEDRLTTSPFRLTK